MFFVKENWNFGIFGIWCVEKFSGNECQNEELVQGVQELGTCNADTLFMRLEWLYFILFL